MTNLHTTTIAADPMGSMAELVAYAGAARRGDILPGCMRLTNARAEAEWTLRLSLARAVGPACPQATLDQACEFMPDAPEPRLLRAARSIAIAERATCETARGAWLAFAHNDLVDASRLDPMDPTARVMLADLVGASAWSFDLRHAA